MRQQIANDLKEIVGQFFFKNCLMVGIAMALFYLCYVLFRKENANREGIEAGEKKIEIKKTRYQNLAWCFFAGLFFMYLCFLFELTLVNREAGSRIGMSLKFFGTYAPDLLSKTYMVENLLLFLPFGFLLPWIFTRMRSFLAIMSLSLLCSLFIETTQLITKRGYFQVDDIWLNVLGGVIGFLLWKIIHEFGSLSFLFAGISILIFCIIFGFSAQNGTESSQWSDIIAKGLSKAIEKIFHYSVSVKKLIFPVRKTAHMSEYAAFWLNCFLMWVTGWRYRCKKFAAKQSNSEQKRDMENMRGRKKSAIPIKFWSLSIFMAFCTACSDEFHQLYVPGRCGQFRDVGWDMLGVGICVLFTALIVSFLIPAFCHIDDTFSEPHFPKDNSD